MLREIMPLKPSETNDLLKVILEKLEHIETHERKTNMLLTDLAGAITSIDTTINTIATAVSAAPAGSVPQPAVDALTKLTADVTALQNLVTPPAPVPPPAP